MQLQNCVHYNCTTLLEILYCVGKPVAIVTNGEVDIYENHAKGMKCYRISVAKTLVLCAHLGVG